MDDLSVDEVTLYTEKLHRLQADLNALARGAMQAGKPVTLDQQKVGRLSRMDALQSQAMAHETRRRRALELRRIEAALKRVDDGEFGFCTVCGEAIEKRRLDLDPAAATCVDHAR